MVPSTFDVFDVWEVDSIEGEAVVNFMPFAAPPSDGEGFRFTPAEDFSADEDAVVICPWRDLLDFFILIGNVDFLGKYFFWNPNRVLFHFLPP